MAGLLFFGRLCGKKLDILAKQDGCTSVPLGKTRPMSELCNARLSPAKCIFLRYYTLGTSREHVLYTRPYPAHMTFLVHYTIGSRALYAREHSDVHHQFLLSDHQRRKQALYNDISE